MLVFHVSVKGGIGKVGLVAVVAPVVTTLYIILRPTLLLFLVAVLPIFSIVVTLAFLPTYYSWLERDLWHHR